MLSTDNLSSRIKLQDVRVFMAVVQAGSMGKAARQLNIGQPNISKSIADLERALGVRLLDRHRQGIEPTEFGRALLDCGITIFDDLQQGLKAIRALANPTAGEVRIGSTAFLAASFLPEVMDRITRRHPQIGFQVVTAPEMRLRALKERSIELLVARRYGPFADEGLNFEPLFEDTFVVVAGAKHPLARKRKLALADLAGQPWVLPPPESAIWSVAKESFRLAGLDLPAASAVAGLPEMRISLLATGRFLTIFPVSAVRFYRRPDIKVLPVELPVAGAPVGIITLKDRAVSPVARLFVEQAREVAKPLAGGGSKRNAAQRG